MRVFALLAGVLALACATPASPQSSDPFGGYSDAVTGPCRHWTVVIPSDTTDLPVVPKALYVGSGGDLKMIGVSAPSTATGVVWAAVPSSSLLPVRPRRIFATGTTASQIVACL